MKFAPYSFAVMLGAAVLCTQPSPVRAEAFDPLIEGAKLCTRHLPRYEREYGIPTHLLSAIASTESGRYHQGLKIKLPWPWTINAEGKGYYFDSKAEAVAAARKFRNSGIKSMDVGCMQVNLYHHPDAFNSFEQAFEPEYNVAYAASFLRGLYQETGNWKDAAGDYHSKTPQRGNQYVGLVYNSWYNIIDRLRAARLNVPASSVDGLRDMGRASTVSNVAAASAVQAADKSRIVRVPDNATSKYTQSVQRATTGYKSPRMNSITVSNNSNNRTSRENGVTIVRPEIRIVNEQKATSVQPSLADILPAKPPETMVIAQAKQDVSAVPITVIENAPPKAGAKIIRLDNQLLDRRPVNIAPVKATGPNFIFND